MSNEEDRPFLEDDGEKEGSNHSSPTSFNHRRCILLASVTINMLLLAVCVFLSVTVLILSNSRDIRQAHQKQSHSLLTEPYSPANAAIEYEYRSMIPNDTRFTGHPGLEWENSMKELMAGTLIRISDEELKLSGSDSIPLKDGGYAAGLGVGHNLHCVRQIKKFLYREHFYVGVDPYGEEFDYLQSHADHCLDFLRQDMLCHLDYSLYTVYWGERRQDIPTHHNPGVQKCVNWDKLKAWMSDRVTNTDMLVRP